KLKDFLHDKNEQMVGWLRFRRNVKLVSTFRNKLLHEEFVSCFRGENGSKEELFVKLEVAKRERQIKEFMLNKKRKESIIQITQSVKLRKIKLLLIEKKIEYKHNEQFESMNSTLGMKFNVAENILSKSRCFSSYNSKIVKESICKC
ncbi:unnamed protein product, partial [Heterotrigona itama]